VIHPMQYELEQARQADCERRAAQQLRVTEIAPDRAAHPSFARYIFTRLSRPFVPRSPAPDSPTQAA
jgi:hypothetical protein